MYKIDQGIVAIPATVYLQPVTGYTTRGHNRKFVVQQSRINAYRHSFFPSTIMLWNSQSTTYFNGDAGLVICELRNGEPVKCELKVRTAGANRWYNAI